MNFKTFFIVDDAILARAKNREFLLKLGATKVIESNNGQEALVKLREYQKTGTRIDCIVCDWMMPEMDGLEFLKTIRSNSHWDNVPFVMATVEGENSNIISAMKSGANGYIVKPFDFDQLKTCIEDVEKAFVKKAS